MTYRIVRGILLLVSKLVGNLTLFLVTLFFLILTPKVLLADDGQVLFFDDFNDRNLDGWVIESGNWIVNSFGQLLNNASGTFVNTRITTQDNEWDDYIFEVDMNNINGVDKGIGFRRIGNTSYDFNLRHGTGFQDTPEIKLFETHNGVSNMLLKVRGIELLNNKFYHFKVEVRGENIKLFVDGTKVVDFTHTGTNIKKGGISLSNFTGAVGFGSALFDNVKVTSLSSAPAPFLDLPWDYEGKGLTFTEAALSMSSYFDHEYPLLSSGLSENSNDFGTLTNFEGKFKSNLDYSSHDGYDYARQGKALLGDPVLAAAAGTARYVNNCGACGNMILIDHGNGYQTRYLHLQSSGLITNDPNQTIQVTAKQPIGKVGATGNVIPVGDAGAHIHFGVFQDRDNDGNFNNNIPDGVTDPFGWQSSSPDPWENYNFTLGGVSKTGNKSFYLWTKKIDNLDATLNSNGGVFKVGKNELNFPNNSTNQPLTLDGKSEPIVKISNLLESLGPSLVVTATNNLGNLVTGFPNFYTLKIFFDKIDLTRFKTDTLSIYSSIDGTNWIKENTILDFINKSATSNLDHMTHFALIGERVDTIPPTTTAVLEGLKGTDNWFRSDVNLILNPQDNTDGLGVDYTLYKLEGQDWEIYNNPLVFSEEGFHKVEFYSVDRDENIEEFKSIEFYIDKQIPEANIYINLDLFDLEVKGLDENETSVIKNDNTNTNKRDDAIYLVSDLAGNSLKLDVRDRDKQKDDQFQIYSLQYNENSPVEQPNNHYKVKYKDKKDKTNIDEQKFEIDKEVKIRIKYDSKDNQSKIYSKEENGEKLKETKDGLVLLQLNTNQGNLEYSY